MKGDFTRDTFRPEKHYQRVLMQQGRVQLDADWNEQTALAERRDETAMADLVGGCGGPAESAGFAIVTSPALLADLPADPVTPIRQFALSPGRYYVAGLQCEVESAFLFSWQPDHREAAPLPPGDYLIFLDVWARHITVHEDGDIREAALGGPDTGTRLQTLWQVRAAPLDAPFDPDSPPADPCHQSAADFNGRQRAALPRLAARAAIATADTEPCTIPASAGYRGLENQLYRVEIHDPGDLGAATFKWSRENGAVVTRITGNVIVAVDGENRIQCAVSSTGPDDNLGFKKEDLVEIVREADELEGVPGRLALVDDVDAATGKITLKPHDANPLPPLIDLTREPRAPRLRRWEGIGVTAVDPAVNEGFISLESGVEVQFELPLGATLRTGDYWQIPARTASPDAQSGKVEWPASDGAPAFLPPRGITHHFARLGVVTVQVDETVTLRSDCRCLWPAITAVPRLFYVSGDGQEVMPDLTAPAGALFQLPRPLIVGLANAHCLNRPTSVRFEVVNTIASPSSGRVALAGEAPTDNFVIVPLDAQGLAQVDFYLDGENQTQQVSARLLDAADLSVSLPVIFNASLSVASQVAYDPAGCSSLAGQKTVQAAIARLAVMASLYKLSGDGQQAAAGATLKEALRVRAASRCGPAAKIAVTFKVILGGGTVTPESVVTDDNGEAGCEWQLGSASGLQVVEAEFAENARRPTTEPRRVHFVAHLTETGSNDPAPVRVVRVALGERRDVPLVNDMVMPLGLFLLGWSAFCNRVIEDFTVVDPVRIDQGAMQRGQPTCFLTVEVPFPLTGEERAAWKLSRLAAYRPFILHGQVSHKVLADDQPVRDDDKPRSRIDWLPLDDSAVFLRQALGFMKELNPRSDRILIRLTLKGNFIWNVDAKRLFEQGVAGGFLDGETFRSPRPPSNLTLPSGDNRRGGDFEMWFWLTA